MEAPVSTKTFVRTLLTGTSIDDEDRGDGFFFRTEISPPRYLLTCFFDVDNAMQYVRTDGKRSIDETPRREKDVDSDMVDGQMASDNGEVGPASVAEALVGAVAKVKDVFGLRVDG